MCLKDSFPDLQLTFRYDVVSFSLYDNESLLSRKVNVGNFISIELVFFYVFIVF